MMRPRTTTLDDLVSPRSIAIVGASDDKRRIGGRPLAHMIEQRFDGAVYPVNANRETVQGLRAYPSVSDIPGDVDFVLVAVPAPSVPEVVRQAAEKNAKTVLIFSSGFAEMGPHGAVLQAQLSNVQRKTGIRVVGPNCLGAFNSERRFYPTFTSTIDRATPVPGGIGIISQSGAYGSHIYLVSHFRGLGIRYWLTTGNESDVHVAEVIKLLAEDDGVHTIMAYAESIKDGPALIDALETARMAKKPVIVMKVGRSSVGAAAASSHTASMAGEDAIYDTIFRQYGAHRVRSTEEMLDVAYASKPRIYPAGRKVGLITISGGAGVLMADAAEDYGLDVAPMPTDAQVELKTIVPFASPLNPVDVTAQFFNDLTLVPRFTQTMLDRGGYDALIGFWTSVAGSPLLADPLITALIETMKGRADTLFLQSIVAPPEVQKRYEDAGFPCFEDPTRAIAAMAALMHFGRSFAAEPRSRPAVPSASALPPGPLGEREAKQVLARFGLPVVQDQLAQSAEDAGRIAGEIGAPVALKIASPDIAHKTDVGGIALGIVGADAARAAAHAIIARVRSKLPDARIDGVLVAPMVGDGVDCILGAKIDPVFGPVVLFGLGGIFAEVMQDVAMRHAPVDLATAREMILELKGAALLQGARGTAACDLDALGDAISRFSVFAAAYADAIESAEINPLRAFPAGCCGLDALIIKRPTQQETQP
ncbi:MAG: acetate--CoA ligase family protein [Hyphomicrobiaceae bacterium]